MIAVRFALANDVCDSLVRRAYFCFDQKAEEKKFFLFTGILVKSFSTFFWRRFWRNSHALIIHIFRS